MNFAKRLTAGIILCIFLLGLAACDSQEAPPTTPTEPLIGAVEAYKTAKAQLLAAPHRVLSYTLGNERRISGQTDDYFETISGTASYSDFGTDQMVAIIKETLNFGSVSAENLLSFCNNRAYSRISGSIFGMDITAEEFIAEQLPATLLDADLYGSVSYAAGKDDFVILFSQPTAIESWVNTPANAKLTTAIGTATLDKNGVLTQTTYHAEYSCGNTSYTLRITMRCTTPAQLELSALHPEHPEDYVLLSCLEAPKLLLRAAGDIFSSKAFSAEAQETIYSQIIPLTRARRIRMELSGTADSLYALFSNNTTITDYRDQPNTTTQEYQFTNGACYAVIDNAEPVLQPGITASSMRTSMEDTLLSALFATRYLAGATLTEEDDVYRLEFAGNEAYCNDLTQELSAFLNLNMEGATSHHSTQAGGYLCIDKVTGLPVAMGMYFSRTHMFGDIPYVLSYQLDQTLTLSPGE